MTSRKELHGPKKGKDLWQAHKKSGWDPFSTYVVTIRLKDVVGGKPASPELIARWIEATCKKKSAEDRAKIVDAHIDTLDIVTGEKTEQQTTVFARVNGGALAIEGRQVKALLKESANIIKTIGPDDVKNLRSKVADQVFVEEEFIQLGRTEPDEHLERPIHVITPQGPRTSIKRVEIVKDATITFTIKRRRGNDKQSVPEKTLLAILDYAQTVGLGADRSQGFGTFEVVSVEKLDA